MEKMRLGRTGIMASRSAFGALPIQRVDFETAKKILRKAYENGINFFDTARVYSDSEEKIAYALGDVRKEIFLATKTQATTREQFWSDLHTSLAKLGTDYIDLYQLHNPSSLPDPDDPDGLYAALLEAKKQGLVRFIGITNHHYDRAMQAVASGLYDTLQFPFSCLSNEKEVELTYAAKRADMGFIAMKGMSGGLISDAELTFSFIHQYDHILPIWGIQRESELDQFLALEKNPPALDQEMMKRIEEERKALSGNFCRGCGYCMPCPVGIPIPLAARMALFIKRSPMEKYVTPEFQQKMAHIEECLHCNQCKSHCPYELDTPSLLQENYQAYKEYLATL